MKVCRKCGRTLHDGFAICPRDSAPLFTIEIEQQQPVEQQMPDQQSQTSSRTRASQLRAAQSAQTGIWRASVVVPAGAVACLLIAGVVYFMMRSEASANQSSVRSVDELIKSGENEKALDILQKWKSSNIETASDVEKMDKLILKLAADSKNDPDEGITLLSELSPHSAHKKEAAELLKQLKVQKKNPAR